MASSSKMCDPCLGLDKYVEGINFCPDCEEKLCTDCTSYHKTLKATKNHHLVDIGIAHDLPDEIAKQQHCVVHKNYQLEYFCGSHDVMCCRACLADDHKTCDSVIPLETASMNGKSALKDSDDEVQYFVQAIQSFDTALSNNTSQLNDGCREIVEKIGECKKKAIARIEETEKKLLKDLQKTKGTRLKQVEETGRKLNNLSENLATQKKQIQFVQEHGTDKQAFILSQNLKDFLQECDKSLINIASSTQTTVIRFQEYSGTGSFDNIGTISELEGDSPVKYIPLKQKHAQCITDNTARILTSFERISQFSCTEIESSITGMVVCDDGNIILCNYPSSKVNIYSQQGVLVKCCIMQRRAYDIAKIPNSSQHVVSLPQLPGIQFIREEDKPGKLVKLQSVYVLSAVTATSEHIFVGGCGEIFVLDTEGSFLTNITVTQKLDRITGLLSVANTLLCYNESGNMYSIDLTTDQVNRLPISDTIKSPVSIITDNQGYIYIGCSNTNKIQRFTKDFMPDVIIMQ